MESRLSQTFGLTASRVEAFSFRQQCCKLHGLVFSSTMEAVLQTERPGSKHVEAGSNQFRCNLNGLAQSTWKQESRKQPVPLQTERPGSKHVEAGKQEATSSAAN